MVLIAVLLAACGDLFSSPRTETSGTLRIGARFATRAPSAALVEVALVNVQVRRMDGTLLTDTTIVVAPTQSTVVLELRYSGLKESERVDVTARLFDANAVPLYRGTAPEAVLDGPPVEVGLVYVGPSTVATSVSSVLLTPVGSTTTVTAIVRDPDGAAIVGIPSTWRSANPSVATVSATGAVLAVGVGTTALIATAYGLESPPLAVEVANRHVWIGGNGDWFTASNWSGGKVPSNRADVDITSDGDYTVVMPFDHFTDIATLRVGRVGNTGRQTLLVNPGDAGSGTVLNASELVIEPSGIVDATAWIPEVPVLQNNGQLRMHGAGFLPVGYVGSSTSELFLDGGVISFQAFGTPAPVTNAGRITGSGLIDATLLSAGLINAGVMQPRGGLILSGGLTMQLGSRLDVRVGGILPGTQYDVLTVLGSADVAGARLDVTASYTPASANEFTVLATSMQRGQFKTATGLQPPAGPPLGVAYDARGTTLYCCVFATTTARR